MKGKFYFSHDANARNDEKILKLRMQLGAGGYGIYFMLLEKLLETDDYILRKDYNTIAFDLRVSSSDIKSVIEDFGLFDFTEDGECLYSESLMRRMKPLDNIRKQRSEAGLKSAEKRKKVDRGAIAQTQETQRPLQKKSTTVERPLPFFSTNKSKVNNINILLEKESKQKKYNKKKFFENFDDEKKSSLKSEKINNLPPSAPLDFSSEDEVLEAEEIKEIDLTSEILILSEENVKDTEIPINGKNNALKRFNFGQELLNAGFKAEFVEEWLKIRKQRKAVNSEIAFKNFMREVNATGRDKNEVMEVIIQKQWRGFEAQWLDNLNKNKNYATNNSTEPRIGRTTISEIERGLTGWE